MVTATDFVEIWHPSPNYKFICWLLICVLFEWFFFGWLVGWAFLFCFCFDEEVEHKNYFCSKALVYK